MSENKHLVSAGARIVGRNQRYLVWFYFLNLVFAWLGASGLATRAHAAMDHSLYSDRLLHGFDEPVLEELLALPEFGPAPATAVPATIFAALFLVASLVLLPGVLLSYASDRRPPRDEFCRACTRNIWRFVRLFLWLAIVTGVVSGLLFWGLAALVTAAEKTSSEKLPFFTQLGGIIVILLILTACRIWFDLAQTNVVLRHQGAVRKALAQAFLVTRRNLVPLLASYVAIAIVALGILVAGIVLWNKIVPPSSLVGAFIIGQATLLLLLAARFWQRSVSVALHLRQRIEPSVADAPVVGAVEPMSS